MSPLEQQIEDDYKSAFKAHHQVKVAVLRMVKSAIKNAEIAARHELSEEEVMDVMTKEAKRRRESIAMYQQGGRQDLVDQENLELQELMFYLPTQLSDSELEAIVKTTIDEMKATTANFGQVMGAVMAKAKGQADGSRVTPMVKAYLK